MNAGDVLRFQYSSHLWVVISDPAKDRGSVLLANFSSIKSGVQCDPACILNPDDHEYIRKPTFVYYRHAQVLSDSELERRISCGQASCPYPPVSAGVLKRIRDGASASRFIKRGHRQLLEDQGLI